MTFLNFFLSWTPILLVFIMAVFFRARALTLAIGGLLYTIFLALFFFKTQPGVIGMAALDGVMTTVPLLLVVYCGILLSLFLLEKGSLQRLAGWIATGRMGQTKKSLLLSLGVGNFLEGAGIIAEPVAAPMIRSAGMAPTAAAVLSIAGYAGLMHLSLAGVIVTVLAAVTGLPAQSLAWDLAILSFPAVILLTLMIPWLIKRPYQGRNLVALIFSSLLAASVAMLTVRYIGYSMAGMLAGIAVVAFSYVMARQIPGPIKGIWQDMAPFLLIFVCLASVNLIPPLRTLVFEQLVIPINLVPGHTINLRPFFDAYLYLFLAFLLALKLHAAPQDGIRLFLKKSNQKAIRAVIAMALFGAMGQVIAYSGYSDNFQTFEAHNNMAVSLAQGLIAYTGNAYPLFAPFLGWVGTFLTGYGVASIMLFGKLQMETATALGISPSFLVSALAVGASVGSISSPFKIAIATPLCGAEGQEGEILRKTIPLGIGISFGVGLFTLLWISMF